MGGAQIYQQTLERIDGIILTRIHQTFEGDAFHTARWDHGVDLRNKRIGVIGTGSTAAQLMKPLSDDAKEVYNFQRT